MKGSIRFFAGLLITAGAVGGIETETATLLQGTIVAAIGLVIMYSGANALRENV
jgi:hypothetical protein